MKSFRWDPQKNILLKQDRGIGFEQVAVAVEAGNLLQIAPHQNSSKYPRQKIMIVAIDTYVYLVPFIEERDHYFLKTIIPSRKATRDFIEQGDFDDQA